MSSKADPYEVLGVTRTASDDEIRAAYRALARTHHPDVSDEPDAEAKFAEVQEAYEILSDAEKRAAYDRFGHAASASAGPGPGYRTQQVDPSQFEDLFADMFGGGFGGMQGGGPSRARAASARPTPRRGADVQRAISVTFQTAALGGTEHLEFDDGTTVDLHIPAGVEDGAKLRLRGRGGGGLDGGERGDVIVTIKVGGHPWFTRRGRDLMVDVPITIVEAACGTRVRVALLQGSVDLTVPPGSSSGTRLRVKGQGMLQDGGDPGDLYAIIQVVAPEGLSESDMEKLKTLAQDLPDPRQDAPGVSSLREHES